MRPSIALAALALCMTLALSSACAASDTLLVDGVARTYTLVAPSKTGRLPLVVALHGHGGSGEQLRRSSGWDTTAQDQRFAVVYPDGLNQSWEMAASSVTPGGNRDVAFLVRLINKLVVDKTVDPRRVYITGVSNGGGMVYRMLCEKSQFFAAVSPVSAGVIPSGPPGCQSSKPLPILIMNGTADPMVPYTGGPMTGGAWRGIPLMSVEQNVGYWRARNGCSAADAADAAKAELKDINKTDKSTVTTLTSSCPARRDIERYWINSGGHEMPHLAILPRSIALENQLGPQNHDISGADEIWKFFKRFAL